MRRFKSATLPLAILALVGLTACDGSSDPISTIAPPDGFQSAEMQLLDYEDVLATTGDATLQESMAFPADLPEALRRGHGPHAGLPLRALDLDEEQRALIRAAFESNRECMREPLAAFREATGEILQEAEQMRMAILEALHDQEITPEEAGARLHALSRATRDAIRDNPASDVLRDAICECREELFEAIRDVLDDEQRESWDRWVSRHAGECARS